MTFPLTHEPAEFVQPDKIIQTATRSSVTDLFDHAKFGPKKVDSTIIHGMFLLRNLTVPLPHTLRGLVHNILIKALKISKERVDFVLDTYNSPCLKDITRDIRGDNLDDSNKIYTFGSGQKTPSNFLNLLKYSNFKKAFLRFFYQEIQKNEFANIFDHKVFYCSVGNECICLQCDEEGMLQVEDVHDLYGIQGEADTSVAFHTV